MRARENARTSGVRFALVCLVIALTGNGVAARAGADGAPRSDFVQMLAAQENRRHEAREAEETELPPEILEAEAAFEALLAKLPRRRPSGRPIRRVAVLGLWPQPGIESLLQRWLLPRRPDLAALEEELFAATSARRASPTRPT